MGYNKYFASMNTNCGFKSYFDTIFNPSELERLYIIKGGSGTGKSTMMKKIEEYFEKMGNNIEDFFCSADPNSLDGILIDKKIGIIDGTAPHITDPKFPGAVDEIVELGEYIDRKSIENRKYEIMQMIQDKAECYKTGYSFLSAAYTVKREIKNIVSKNFEEEKMLKAIIRYFKQNNLKGEKAEEEIRLISCIGSKGQKQFNTFERKSKKICCVTNCRGCENIFFKAFFEYAKKQRLKTVISYDPICCEDINALYFPEVNVCVVAKEESDYYNDKCKVFNMERFIDKKTLTENRVKLRFANKCFKKLVNGAEDAFAEAGNIHETIEKIYRANTDFKRVEETTEKLIRKIEETLNR